MIWLYTGQLPPHKPKSTDTDVQERLIDETGTFTARYRDEDLVSLWIFADCYSINKLFNLCISLLAKQNTGLGRTTSKEAVCNAFQHRGRTALQRYLVDEAVHHLGMRRMPHKTTTYPLEYVGRVLHGLAKNRKLPAIWVKNACVYHLHDGDSNEAKSDCHDIWHDHGGPDQRIDNYL